MSELAKIDLSSLPPDERASKLLNFDATKAKLAELAKRSEGITEITNTAGREECHSAYMTLKNQRVTIEKTGKEARDDANKFSKAVIDKEKELIAVIRPEETRLQMIRDEYDGRIEAERIRIAQAEQARVDAHIEAIRKMREFPLSLQGKPSSVIESRIADFESLHGVVAWDIYEEFREQANDAYVAAIASARDLLKRQREHEAEQERVRRQDEENKALRERLEAMEREKEEAEAKVREAEKAQQRAEQSRVDVIRSHIAAIMRVPLGIEFAKIDAIQEEIDALEILSPYASTFDFQEFTNEAKQAYDETMRMLSQAAFNAQRHAEEEALSILRRAEEEKRLAEKAEANRVEAARLEEQRLKNLTMRDAVFAVIQWASDHGHDKEKVFRDLEAVIDNEVPEKRTAAKPVRKPMTQA